MPWPHLAEAAGLGFFGGRGHDIVVGILDSEDVGVVEQSPSFWSSIFFCVVVKMDFNLIPAISQLSESIQWSFSETPISKSFLNECGRGNRFSRNLRGNSETPISKSFMFPVYYDSWSNLFTFSRHIFLFPSLPSCGAIDQRVLYNLKTMQALTTWTIFYISTSAYSI